MSERTPGPSTRIVIISHTLRQALRWAADENLSLRDWVWVEADHRSPELRVYDLRHVNGR